MDERMTVGEQNLLLLESLFPGNEKLYVWCYGLDGRFVASSCPEEERELLEPPFVLFGGLEKARAHSESEERDRPLITLIEESLEGLDEKAYKHARTPTDRVINNFYQKTKNITLRDVNDLDNLLKDETLIDLAI